MMCSNIVQNIWSYAWKTKQESLKKKDDEECDTESIQPSILDLLQVVKKL